MERNMKLNDSIYIGNGSTKHINYINDTLYGVNDICDIFNFDIDKIIEAIHSNNIEYLYDSKGNLYINSKDIYSIFTLINTKESINNQEFNSFLYCINRNAFGENQYDRINKRILLNM
jgi:hypothetical protein